MRRMLGVSLSAAVFVIASLAVPTVAQAKPKPSFTGISISSNNRSGSKFTVSVQVRRASEVGVCVAVAHTTSCEYATKRGGSFNAPFHIGGARRSSKIDYFVSAIGPGGQRFTAGTLTENSGTGVTTIG